MDVLNFEFNDKPLYKMKDDSERKTAPNASAYIFFKNIVLYLYTDYFFLVIYF